MSSRIGRVQMGTTGVFQTGNREYLKNKAFLTQDSDGLFNTSPLGNVKFDC